MKVAARQADSFARNPDAAARAVLVYGPDAGLASERVQTLIAGALADPADPFRRVDLTGDTLEAHPAMLADEAAALNLTGGRRVVVVRGAGDRHVAAFATVLEAPSGDAFIVVEAGNLGPRSTLRRAFEKSATAAALSCYADDAGSLPDLIRRTLQDDGVTADAAAVDFLVGQLGGDRLLSRRELEKLALYVGAGGTATAEDARAIVGDAGALSLDQLADAVASGDREGLEGLLDRSYRFGNKPVTMLGAIARHLQKLEVLVAQMEAGSTADQAMRGLRPPVFFKRQAALLRQLDIWTAANLGRAMNIVAEAELACKTTGMPDRPLCERALLQVATAARSR